jgi:hypothetical protein
MCLPHITAHCQKLWLKQILVTVKMFHRILE